MRDFERPHRSLGALPMASRPSRTTEKRSSGESAPGRTHALPTIAIGEKRMVRSVRRRARPGEHVRLDADELGECATAGVDEDDVAKTAIALGFTRGQHGAKLTRRKPFLENAKAGEP